MSRFLSLPRELRDQIYLELFHLNEAITLTSQTTCSEWQQLHREYWCLERTSPRRTELEVKWMRLNNQPLKLTSSADAGLISVCRSTYYEVMPLIYSRRFVIDARHHQIARFLSALSYEAKSYISSIELGESVFLPEADIWYHSPGNFECIPRGCSGVSLESVLVRDPCIRDITLPTSVSDMFIDIKVDSDDLGELDNDDNMIEDFPSWGDALFAQNRPEIYSMERETCLDELMSALMTGKLGTLRFKVSCDFGGGRELRCVREVTRLPWKICEDHTLYKGLVEAGMLSSFYAAADASVNCYNRKTWTTHPRDFECIYLNDTLPIKVTVADCQEPSTWDIYVTCTWRPHGLHEKPRMRNLRIPAARRKSMALPISPSFVNNGMAFKRRKSMSDVPICK